METLGSYLLQMACWLAGFWLVYVAVLRKETFFALNRWFLLTGLLASLVLPLFPVRYDVVKPPIDLTIMKLNGTVPLTDTVGEGSVITFWMAVYLTGITFFILRFVWQSTRLLVLRRKSEPLMIEATPVFKLEKDTAPFSFFNSIYISKKMCGETELNTVVAHEKVHIDERHWADLLLLEVARALQWFNPLLILYRKAMMQNHEYLADNGTLQKGVSARTYKAVLANQMLGIPVLQVANGFTLFDQTKRILMMNKNKTKPVKRLKLLWALPVMALIMVAFAKPNYVAGNENETNVSVAEKTITVKGKVTNNEGKPLEGAAIVVKNSTTGTVSDAAGNFKLEGINPDAEIRFSYVGYETKEVKAKATINVSMKPSVIVIGYGNNGEMAPPPPPPPPPFEIKGRNGGKPLIILDGKAYEGDMGQIDPNTIEKVEVLKDQSAVATYGDKGKDGVILITSKKQQPSDETFIIIEQPPTFPGRTIALNNYINNAIGKITGEGKVRVIFTVAKDGSIKDAKVEKGISENLNKRALEIIYGMPKWEAAIQNGKPIETKMSLELEF